MGACVFPGSFDPPTIGHLDIICRAASMFDTVTVTVMLNRSKEGVIPVRDRESLLRIICRRLDNVEVDCWDGLLSDYMRKRPGQTVVRGIRNAQEFAQEKMAFLVNKALFPAFDTVFLSAGRELSAVSSSAVREIASFGGDIRPFIPKEIQNEVCQWLRC